MNVAHSIRTKRSEPNDFGKIFILSDKSFWKIAYKSFK